jgi:hypothetical protein
MTAAAFELHDQLGEIVIDNPPLNVFSEALRPRPRHVRQPLKGPA